MVHLAGCRKEVTTMEYAQIFVDNVFRLHNLLEVIISDRDPRFTSKFWRSLFDLLHIDLWFSTMFHPQTDGQSERMIQTVVHCVRVPLTGTTMAKFWACGSLVGIVL